MQHDTPLITTIVVGLVLAYILGMIANRLKMPPLVGYLLAGVLTGPYTPGFVADQALGSELAELGVILLMFGVGLHFSLKDLMSVRALAIPGAIVQIGFATLLGLGLALLMGWGIGAGLLFGLALSVASTVVLLKALQDRRLIETERGRIAVGWLIVEDLAMVLALVLIPAIASLYGLDTGVHDPFVSFVERLIGGDVGIWGVLGLTVIKVAAFVGFMLIVGRRVIPWGLHATAHTGSRELFRLAVLAIALGVALGSAVLFGVSLALGAFFAGMILSESELSHRAAQETLPLRDAFSVLFFVSVGMLFDPTIILTDPLPVIATVLIIIVGKSAAALAIVLLFRRPLATALTISASLAQIGEFSFILASMGVALAILPPEGQDLILAGALISIVLNPAVFWALDLAKPRLEARAAQRRAEKMERDGVRIEPTDIADAAAGPITSDAPREAGVDTGAAGADDDVPEAVTLTGHTVLVGFGRVGRVVGEGLHAAGAPLVVIEDSDHSIAAARTAGITVVVGNAASADVLRLANLPAARCLMIAIPDGFEAGTVCEVGRKLNPSVRIIARAHSDEEEAHLRGLGADAVIMGEREIGLAMLAWLQGDKAAAPVEPQLPPVENLLAKAAAAPVAETVVIVGPPVTAAEAAVEADVSGEDDAVTEPQQAVEAATLVEPEVAGDADAAAAAAPEAEATPAADMVGEPDPLVDQVSETPPATEPVAVDDAAPPPEPFVGADPVVIEAVEAASEAPASPDHDGTPPAASLESFDLTPAVGEAPAEIDEVVVPPAEPPVEPTAEPGPVTETEAEIAAEAEAEAEANAETNEGGIAPPEPDEAAEEKPAVPAVTPEPKS